MHTDEINALAAFHTGEVQLQQRSGRAEKMAEIGKRVVRRYMPDQHREFFAQLPALIVGVLDQTGQPWASVLTNRPGFITSPQPDQLLVAAHPDETDPIAAGLVNGAPIGLLGIEPHTRRRNRANGWIRQLQSTGLALQVVESFGNCPKYIQPRQALYKASSTPGEPQHANDLWPALVELIEEADTFFIASAHPDAATQPGYGLDVSHRGGPAGFVKVTREADGDTCLWVPDFSGNFFFNTLGNVVLNPRVGLLFIDYRNADVLQLAGHAVVVEHPAAEQDSDAVARFLKISVRAVVFRQHALPLVWRAVESSVA